MRNSPPKLRILLITNWIGWAGAETQLAHLAIGLRARGHEVVLLAIGKASVDFSKIEKAGVRVVSLNVASRREKLLVPFRLRRYASWADVVHCTGWDATLWGRLGAIVARRPMVITEHTPGREHQILDRGRWRLRLFALHTRLLDRFTFATIVVGEWQRRLVEAEGVRPDSIVHIPNAVPVTELRAEADDGFGRAELGIPDDALVIVEVARFATQKGQGLALSTAAKLRQELGDVRAVFVGEGVTEPEVRAEAERIGADWASFLGQRDDVPALLGLADVSVLPSTGEGLPMSLIEAIAIGTPVIGTDVGDVRWLIEETGGGICVEVGDDEGFVDACRRILADRELRRSLHEAALAGIGEFDAPVMVERYERVLAGAAATRG
jgi:glycosyltransferase involved in cell wall biosynthesis